MAEKMKKEEFEKIVLDLSKKGLTNEKIGLTLKKEHKVIPRSIEKISKILKKHNIHSSPDITNLKSRVKKLEKHSSIHKQDRTYRRALSILSAKLRKLESISA